MRGVRIGPESNRWCHWVVHGQHSSQRQGQPQVNVHAMRAARTSNPWQEELSPREWCVARTEQRASLETNNFVNQCGPGGYESPRPSTD